MPFTIAHAAAVLPISRALARWRLLSAAVIGTMVPDFGLFFPWRVTRFETHSAVALLTFCLPVGLATYWVFQYVIKTPLLELLHDGAYARWRPYASAADLGSLRQWLLAACGVLGGALTHLVLDAFSHEGARGVRMLPMLDDPVVEYGGHYLRGVRLVQDGFSLLGLAVVVGVVCYALRGGPATAVGVRALRPGERRVWVCLYMAAAAASSIAWFFWERYGASRRHSVLMVATLIAVASLRGLATALMAVSVALKLRLRAGSAERARNFPST